MREVVRPAAQAGAAALRRVEQCGAGGGSR